MKSYRYSIPLVLAAMLLGIALFSFSLYQTHASETAFESVPSVPPLIKHSTLVGDVSPSMRLSLSVNLSLRNITGLARYVQGEYTPGSYLYHRYLRPAEFAALYGPAARDVQQVANYLRAQGFVVTHAAPGQQVIDFSGTVAQAEHAFAVQIHTYRAANGRLFYANSTAPRLPAALRSLIVNINGLDTSVVRAHPPLRARGLPAPVLPARSPRALSCPGPGSNALQYLLPSQFASAYNYTGAYNSGLHGEGQNIALFELDGYSTGDINAFRSCYDENAPTRINTVAIDGGVSPPSSSALEVELDIEVLLGELRGLTNIVVYEAPNDPSGIGYNDEWNRIVLDDIPVVSTSWGLCEPQISATAVQAENSFFLQADAQGQSIVAAAGDNGAFDCGDGNRAVDDPASNPNITGVGGTRLLVGSGNSYKSESAWSGTPNASNGGGGGVSQIWTMPSYQHGPGVIQQGFSSGAPCGVQQGHYCREVPDVSLNADPDVGYVVYCTVSSTGCDSSTPFLAVGGTSAAAPMWATIVALANQYALARGGTNLGFLNPALYTLLNSPSLYSRAFHDVTGGTNLYYPATQNYDMATGMGTANVYGFVTNVPDLPGTPNVPGSRRWYLAEGHVGNHFQEYLTLENPSPSSSAQVTVNYLLRGKPSFSQQVSLAPSSRTTVNVNSVLNVATNASVGEDVSLYITSDISIVAERPIYFNYMGNTPGGSDIVGQIAPGMHFTFANGETLAGYSTYITVLNPIGQQAATVTASYYSGGALIGQSSMTVPAGQRNTLMANNTLPAGRQFYIQVDSTQPVVVERPMYFRTTVAGISGTVAGGSSVQGVAPATDWYYASGGTGANGAPAQENLIIANPGANGSATAAHVTIMYAFAGGTTRNVNVSVPAKSQLIENVKADVGQAALIAIHVASTNGIAIVTERQQFFSAPALTPAPTGVEEVGETPNAGLPSVYSFAEGHSGNTFSEFITLFNPNNSPITIAITYFITSGSSRFLSQETVSLAATSVAQVSTNNFLVVPASSSGAVPVDTSIVVQSLPANGGSVHALPVIAGRVLYFNYMGTTPGCTSVIGYSG